MAKFKCLVSGTVVEFQHEHDILDMRKHPQYEEVVEVKLPAPVKKENSSTKAKLSEIEKEKIEEIIESLEEALHIDEV